MFLRGALCCMVAASFYVGECKATDFRSVNKFEEINKFKEDDSSDMWNYIGSALFAHEDVRVTVDRNKDIVVEDVKSFTGLDKGSIEFLGKNIFLASTQGKVHFNVAQAFEGDFELEYTFNGEDTGPLLKWAIRF